MSKFNGGFEKSEGKFNKKGNAKAKKEIPAPVYDDFQNDLTADLMEQCTNYLKAMDTLTDAEEIKANESALFNLGSWPLVVDAYPNLEIYTVERNVRTDRETHKLTRANCSIVALDSEKIPAYFVTASITPNHKAAENADAPKYIIRINAIPMGNKGPYYRNTLRISNI